MAEVKPPEKDPAPPPPPPEKKEEAAVPVAEPAPAPVSVPAPAETPPPPANDNPAPAETAAADAKKRPLKAKLFEKGVDVAGFGDILKAWRAEGNRFRNVIKSVGRKAADMIAGRIVSGTFRLIAITWVAGMIGGVSTFGGLALLALATGTASGIYNYGKDYLTERFTGPKEKRAAVKFIDRSRAKSAGISFLAGTATGALGAWLAKTGMLQNAFGAVKDWVKTGGGALSDSFNPEAAPQLPIAAVFNAAAEKADSLPMLKSAPQNLPRLG
ncbi:MAG: hypothetical protein JNM12_03535 [Alphaproteobacteria bacterium]|nr:hypothetical protein [Alphaproteobacteria bacterium]